VPYSPLGYGSWKREASEFSADGHDSPAVAFSLDISDGLEAGDLPESAKAPLRVTNPKSTPEERRRHLRELDLAARRLQHGTPPPAKADFGTEQLFASPGTLPSAPTTAERERAQKALMSKALRQIPPAGAGPAGERIAKVPRRLLTARGADGQNLRREMLRGALVVVFTAGYEGKRFIFEKAHALGIRVVLLESADSWSRCLEEEGKIVKFIPMDMSQSSDAVYRDAMAAIERMSEDPSLGPPDGIATFVELSVPIAARLAEAFGLPGPMPESVDLARDKHKTRAVMADAGLPTPPNFLIRCEAELDEAARKVGFPAVLKPVSGAASLGVKKVVSVQDLRNTYVELDRELRTLVVSSGALVKDDGKGQGSSAVRVIGATFMLERYLDGNEVDVDIIMSEGEWVFAAVSDNGPTLEPYFNETWAVSPSLLPRDQQVALKELAIGTVKSLGFLDGVFHVECKYTSCGPQLIEVNARMGGGPVYETNRRVWNVCLVEETFFAAVGVPSRPNVPRIPAECIANSDVNALKSGKLKNLDFLEPLRNREGVVSFDPHVAAGESVVGPADGLPTWLVEVVVSRPTPKEALDYLLQLESEIQRRVQLE